VDNTQDQFSIQVPGDWVSQPKTDSNSPVHLQFASVDKTASVILMSTDGKHQSCSDFLKGIDQARKKVNILTGEKAKVTPEMLKKSGAGDGAWSEYVIAGKGPGFPVQQRSLCLKRKDKIRVIIGAYRKKQGPQMEPLLAEIFKSFQFLPEKN